MKLIISIVVILTVSIFANNPTDIKTNFGIWKNVQIIDSTDTYYIVKTSEGNRRVYKDAIIKIYYSSYDSTKESSLILDKFENTNINYETDPQYEYPNLPMLSLSAALFYLSYDFYDNGSKINGDLNPSAKSEKTKYMVGGTIFLIAGIVNTVFSLKSVRVYGDGNRIGLSYNL